MQKRQNLTTFFLKAFQTFLTSSIQNKDIVQNQLPQSHIESQGGHYEQTVQAMNSFLQHSNHVQK